MNSLIVCVPSSVTIEDVHTRLVDRGIGVDFRDGRIIVTHERSLAWVEGDLRGELEREYQPDELATVKGLIGDWAGFGIDYRTLDVADVVVAAICERWPCVVDDDDGFIGLGSDYLDRQNE